MLELVLSSLARGGGVPTVPSLQEREHHVGTKLIMCLTVSDLAAYDSRA